MKCAIRWIDRITGQPTPDDNDAIGTARCEFPPREGEQATRLSDPLPICDAHARRIVREGLYNWTLTRFPVVTVVRTPDGYAADFTRHPDAASLRASFDTAIIPLPFTAAADPARVLAAFSQTPCIVEHPNTIIRMDVR